MAEQKNASGCVSKILKSAGILALFLVLILIGLNINQRIALARTHDQFPPPGQLVDVDGHPMHIHCLGNGSPTVVIDARNGSFSVEWTPIQQEISQVTQVCTFDRAGYGWIEFEPAPRDGAQAVAELHTFLQVAVKDGLYILVGHSLGGVYTRLFAAKYPTETAGLVLVETASPLAITPEFESQMQSSIGFYQVMQLLTSTGIMRILWPFSGESSISETARKPPPDLQEIYINLLLDPQQYKTDCAEMQNPPRTFKQTRLAISEHPLYDLPLIVLTAGQTISPGSTPFVQELVAVPPEWIKAQAELATSSLRSEKRILPKSGHSVHLDTPHDAAQVVLDMIEIIK